MYIIGTYRSAERLVSVARVIARVHLHVLIGRYLYNNNSKIVTASGFEPAGVSLLFLTEILILL